MAENAKSGGIKPSFRTADTCFFSDFSPNLPRISGRCGGRLPTLSSLRLQSVSVRRERPAPARRKGSALSGGNGPARRKGSAPSGEKCPALPGEKAPPLPMKNVLPCPTKKGPPPFGAGLRIGCCRPQPAHGGYRCLTYLSSQPKNSRFHTIEFWGLKTWCASSSNSTRRAGTPCRRAAVKASSDCV